MLTVPSARYMYEDSLDLDVGGVPVQLRTWGLAPEHPQPDLVIAFIQWTSYARTARAETLSLREQPYVTAAQSFRASRSFC